MKKIIILLLCCGLLVSMVGCVSNTAPPPTESPPTTVSETVITKTPTEITQLVTAVEPTEKEKEQIMSPSVYAFKRTGNRSGHPYLNKPFRWTQTTVRGMLANQEYCGDTVNFRTYSKSNKLKKRIKNDVENIMVFENTHEAIISRGLFDAVQKHFEGRKRPDQQGEMDKYAGFLFCGECGQKCICTDVSHSLLKRTSFNAADIRPKAAHIAQHTISESRCSTKSCLAEYRK